MKFLFSSLIAVASVLAAAQGNQPPQISLTIPKAKVAAKGAVTAIVTIKFAEGLHGYQNPPSDPTLIPVTIKSADKTFALLKVKYPIGTPMKMDGEAKPISVYEGTVKIPVTLTAPTKLGPTTLSLTVDYQQCNAQACFPPATVTVKGTVTVVKGAVKANR